MIFVMTPHGAELLDREARKFTPMFRGCILVKVFEEHTTEEEEKVWFLKIVVKEHDGGTHIRRINEREYIACAFSVIQEESVEVNMENFQTDTNLTKWRKQWFTVCHQIWKQNCISKMEIKYIENSTTEITTWQSSVSIELNCKKTTSIADGLTRKEATKNAIKKLINDRSVFTYLLILK